MVMEGIDVLDEGLQVSLRLTLTLNKTPNPSLPLLHTTPNPNPDLNPNPAPGSNPPSLHRRRGFWVGWEQRGHSPLRE